MNKAFDRERLELLMAGFVVDDLAPDEAHELDLLLREHPEMADEIEAFQQVLHQLVDGLSEVEPPLYLLDNILDQVDALDSPESCLEGSVTSVAPNSKPARRIGWRHLLTGIAAIAVTALGVDYYRLHQRLGAIAAENQQLRQETAQARIIKTLLKAPETRRFTFENVSLAQPASGSIVMNADQEKAIMMVQNLPKPPSGKAYVLWVVVASEKVPCGEIKPYTWGDGSYELPFTPELYRDFYNPKLSGLVVTLEADPNAPRPKGPVVMRGSRI